MKNTLTNLALSLPIVLIVLLMSVVFVRSDFERGRHPAR